MTRPKGRRNLTEAEVRRIRYLFRHAKNAEEVRRLVDVSRSTVYRVGHAKRSVSG